MSGRYALANYIKGWARGVLIRGIPVLNVYSNNALWVDSNGTSNGEGTFMRPYATLAGAIAKASAHDHVYIKAGHAETLVAAADIIQSVAGLRITGLGEGDKRPVFTFGTSTGASVRITGANSSFLNCIGVAAIDGLTNPFDIRAAGVTLDIEWKDTTDIEAVSVIVGHTDQSADNLTIALVYRGYTGGDACVNPIKLDGTDKARINVDFYGKASTAVVNFVTHACTDIDVRGYIYNSGTTDGSKCVVDTVTGSKWFADVYDGGAGYNVLGGSGTAVTTQSPASQAVPVADVATNTLLRDVAGNKTDAAVTAVGTTKSIIAYAKGLVSMLTVAVADAATNAWAGDVVGNKTDAAVVAVGTTKSILAYVKGLLFLSKRVATVALANTDMTGTTTRWTITGGPIVVRHLGMHVTTVFPAGANTLKFSFTPSGGGATDLSAATDTASAGAQQIFSVDGTKATALVKATDVGISIGGTTETKMPLILGPGVIQTIFSAGPPASGAATLFMQWEPAHGSAAVA